MQDKICSPKQELAEQAAFEALDLISLIQETFLALADGSLKASKTASGMAVVCDALHDRIKIMAAQISSSRKEGR